jgi:lipopolysaccharide/colanic/teichoic acid biosynthesis glycosyltransferase
MIGVRFLAQLILRKKIVSTENILPKIIIAGTKAEGKRALNLLIEAGINHRFLGFVLCEKNFERNENILGNIDELQDICSIYNADEIIFCSKDIPNHNIISWMTLLGTTLNYKIIPEGSMSIIGSNSKNTAGDLYAIDVNLNIASTISKRNKRLFDIAFSLSMIVLFPLIFWVVNNKLEFFKNIFSVLIGQKTWVGYEKNNFKNNNYQLPKIKKSILTTAYLHPDKTLTEDTKARLNLLYAKDYEVYTDWQIIINNIPYLGNQ